MGEPAKKLLTEEPANDTYPPLGKGEFLMRGMNFPVMGAWGNRHLLVGTRYDFDFSISGVVERLVAQPSGVTRAYVRETTGNKPGKLISFLFFPTGAYGPEVES